MFNWAIEFLTAAAANPIFVIGAVILVTFILEDIATVGGALLAAEGILPVPAVLAGLFIGITVGDCGLYGLGRLAGRVDWIRQKIGEDRLARGTAWLEGRMIPAILFARVTPGLRLPCYAACGFVRLPFAAFASVAVVAIGAWSAGAFTLVYIYGMAAKSWLGSFSWIAGAVLLVLLLAWPHIIRLRRKS